MFGVHKGPIYCNNEMTKELCHIRELVMRIRFSNEKYSTVITHNIIKINYTSTPYIQFTIIQIAF